MVGLKDIFGLFEALASALAWPLVILVALIVFRRPLSAFLKEVAGRATKLSVTSIIGVELSLPEASNPQRDQFPPVLARFASGRAFRSHVRQLLAAMGGDKVDYLIVDLGKGDRWLTSRLFIFAVMLQRLRGLRCIVFLETRTTVSRRLLFLESRTHIRRSFLGIASPDEVHQALARRYPWLEQAYIRAHIQTRNEGGIDKQIQAIQGESDPHKVEDYLYLKRIQLMHSALDEEAAASLVNSFSEQVQKSGEGLDKKLPPDPKKESEWVFLRGGPYLSPYWEHANWITRALLETDLPDALQRSDDACFEDSSDISKVERVQAILRRKGAFVALVDKQRKFKNLVDREALLEQVAGYIGTLSDNRLST